MTGYLASWVLTVSAGQTDTAHEKTIENVVADLGVRQEKGLKETVELSVFMT